MNRREFMQAAAGTGVLCRSAVQAATAERLTETRLVSPGCRGSRVRLARLYLGIPKAHYPYPAMDLAAERERYQVKFRESRAELADVDFVVDELVGTPEQVVGLQDRLRDVDGILIVHLTLHTLPAMKKILELNRPTLIFSPPYAGHEWYYLSGIRRTELGRRMECILSTDLDELIAAVGPLRALHHLREAKVVNIAAAHNPPDYPEQARAKFGTQMVLVGRQRVLDLYQSVSEDAARGEAQRWIQGATAVVEPPADEIQRSCRLALALGRLLDEEKATVATVDCYGSMWRQLPAYPCIGFARLNDMGLGGICQSDLPCVMSHIILQGLTGRPGFVCNPTFDWSKNTTTLIHCLGCTKMDGPDKPAAPYKLRDVMEREEGAVPQVTMRVGQQVTQTILDGMTALRYFTGRITATPDTERGCRTQIAVKVDGCAERLWQNWTAGIHRVSCYGELTRDLARFCRLADLKLINEAV